MTHRSPRTGRRGPLWRPPNLPSLSTTSTGRRQLTSIPTPFIPTLFPCLRRFHRLRYSGRHRGPQAAHPLSHNKSFAREIPRPQSFNDCLMRSTMAFFFNYGHFTRNQPRQAVRHATTETYARLVGSAEPGIERFGLDFTNGYIWWGVIHLPTSRNIK